MEGKPVELLEVKTPALPDFIPKFSALLNLCYSHKFNDKAKEHIWLFQKTDIQRVEALIGRLDIERKDTLKSGLLGGKSNLPDKCPECGARIRTNTYQFSMNLLHFFVEFVRTLHESKGGYVKTEQVYDFDFKGSRTATLTQLKYFGLIAKHFEEGDTAKRNSGKWVLTLLGRDFVNNKKPVFTRVTIFRQEAIVRVEPKFIDDPTLEWLKQEDFENLRSTPLPEGDLVNPDSQK